MGLLVLGALGWGGLNVLSQQRPPIAAGLGEIAVSEEAALSFDEKVRTIEAAIDAAKRTGKATAVEVAFTEEELTSKVDGMLRNATGGFAMANMQIHLEGDSIQATSTVNVQGLDLNIGVVAAPVVEGGHAKLVVKEIQTGGLPLPDAIREQLSVQIDTALDPATLGLQIDVARLQVLDGKLVISGTAKP